VMDGVEATRVLRGAGDQTPVLALTANVMQKHRDAFRAAGANGFLNKPIDLDQLRRELSRYLEVVEEAEEGGAAPVMETAAAMEGGVVDDELMQLFIERMQVLKLGLSTALSNEDWAEVHEIAHIIKGSASSYGYPELSYLGAEICSLYDRGHLELLPELTMDLLFKASKLLH